MASTSHLKPDAAFTRLLLDVAERAARAAGQHALREYARRRETVAVAEHDVKLRLDVECQQVAEDAIHRHFPEHAFLAEEQEHGTGEDVSLRRGYEWVVDPIDGTVNFTHGSPHWCNSVAVQHEGETVAGAVFAPFAGHCYRAGLGLGAWRDDDKLAVSDVPDLEHAMVRTGLDQKINTGQPPFSTFCRIASSIQKARVVGAAALDMCRVAEGACDGYYESGIFLWDVAAAELIVREAGGRTEILGRPPAPHALNFLATNGAIHDALRAVVLDPAQD